MALLDAREYDPEPARRRRRIAAFCVGLLLIALVLWFWPSGRFRYWNQWTLANRFFSALEGRDFEKAYGLYNNDPDWKSHAEKYQKYGYAQFVQDWGPSGTLGVISSHQVSCVIKPPATGFAPATGVVAVVKVNKLPDATLLWIENKSHTITTSPSDLESLTRHSPLVRALCYR